jgi:HEAT repeat protein
VSHKNMSTSEMDGVPTLDRLIDQLRNHNWSANWAAAAALAERGLDALPLLTKALEHEDGYVRNGAAIALGKLGSRDATGPLIKALYRKDERTYEDDEDQEARVSIVTALGTLRDRAATGPLLEILRKCLEEKADLTLASYTAEALGTIGDREAIPLLKRAVEFEEIEIQKCASWALAQMLPEGLGVLIEIARGRARRGRQYAVRAIGSARIDSVEALLTKIVADKSDDKLVRGEAARWLGKGGHPAKVRPLLLDALQDPEEVVRSSALIGLGYLRDSASYETILNQLENPSLRYVAVVALGELGDKRACEVLVSLLKSSDPSLCSHAATALGKIGCPSCLQALAELCDRPGVSSIVRNSAEQAIKDIQGSG